MKATANVLCYKSKVLSNGEHPLMLRVCMSGKKKYVSLGISVKSQYWDFEKNKPKRNCPNRERILKVINEQRGIQNRYLNLVQSSESIRLLH